MATIEQISELQMLNECAWECTRQSRWKETTQRYLANMLLNNVELQDELMSGTYRVRPTTDFELNERGHIRQIEAPSVRDRIVQKSLMKLVLLPRLRPYVIYDNYASLADRGTSFARRRFEMMLRRHIRKHGTDGYLLTIDIRKYFENIDHDVLKRLIAPRLEGEPQETIDLIHYIIDTSSKTGCGLNLGSEAPQIFAVYYLNPIDQFVKVVKGVSLYGRYMDDIFVISPSKQQLKSLLAEIETQLSLLRLEINRKKTHIVSLTHGFTWLQVKYSVMPDGRLLKAMSHAKIVRERRRLRAFRRQVAQAVMSEQEVWQCYKSWRGSQAKDHNSCQRTLARIDLDYTLLFPMPCGNHPRAKPSRRAIVKSINHTSAQEEITYCLTA